MTFKMVCVKDDRSNTFNAPVCVRHTGEAVRSFADEVNNPESIVSRHPEDFSLWYLGDFHEDTCVVNTVSPGPERLVLARDLVKNLVG